MGKWKIWIALIMLSVFIAACSAPQSAPAATSAPAEPTTVSASPTADMPEPATPAVAAPTEAAVVDQCITCHTDKDMLISTAKVEEEKPKESEGAG